MTRASFCQWWQWSRKERFLNVTNVKYNCHRRSPNIAPGVGRRKHFTWHQAHKPIENTILLRTQLTWSINLCNEIFHWSMSPLSEFSNKRTWVCIELQVEPLFWLRICTLCRALAGSYLLKYESLTGPLRIPDKISSMPNLTSFLVAIL